MESRARRRFVRRCDTGCVTCATRFAMMRRVSALERNNVITHGPPDARPMVFAHGFGCDQNMWRYVWPAFAEDHRIVLFDHVGMGGSDLAAFDRERYGSLRGYAEDVVEILRELELSDAVFVGHSV